MSNRSSADEIREYLQQLAPHVKQRRAARLLREALTEIERLHRLNEDKHRHLQAYCKAASEDKAEIRRLQAIVDRLHRALCVAGRIADTIGDYDLHELAYDAYAKRTRDNECLEGEAGEDDYAEAFILAVERTKDDGDDGEGCDNGA